MKLALLWLLGVSTLSAGIDSKCAEYGAMGDEPGLCLIGASTRQRERCDSFITGAFTSCLASAAKAYDEFQRGDEEGQKAAKQRFAVALNAFQKMFVLADSLATDPGMRRRLQRVKDAMPALEMNKRQIEKVTGESLALPAPPTPPSPPPASAVAAAKLQENVPAVQPPPPALAAPAAPATAPRHARALLQKAGRGNPPAPRAAQRPEAATSDLPPWRRRLIVAAAVFALALWIVWALRSRRAT